MGRYKFKVALIGDFGTGKSAIYRRITDNRYDPETTNSNEFDCDFKELDITVGDNQIKVTLWDTAGMEEHNSLEGSYFRGLSGFLLVYDVCNWKSYERIDHWKTQINAYAMDGVKLILVGNKADAPKKQRVVDQYDGKTLAATMKVPFFEVSAQTGDNCTKALEFLCQLIIEDHVPATGLHFDSSKAEFSIPLAEKKVQVKGKTKVKGCC